MDPAEGATVITVAELMSTNVKTLQAGATLADVYQLMRASGIRHVPIVDTAGALLGIVSYQDIMAATPTRFDQESRREVAYSHSRASDIMTTDVATVSVQTSARQAAQAMQKRKIGCLPVLDGARLVGIVTAADFLGLAARLMAESEKAEAATMLRDTGH